MHTISRFRLGGIWLRYLFCHLIGDVTFGSVRFDIFNESLVRIKIIRISSSTLLVKC